MAFEWNQHSIDTLRDMWAKGETCKRIADHLGNGLTRNAVAGKASRLGLMERGNPIGKKGVYKAELKPREPYDRSEHIRVDLRPGRQGNATSNNPGGIRMRQQARASDLRIETRGRPKSMSSRIACSQTCAEKRAKAEPQLPFTTPQPAPNVQPRIVPPRSTRRIDIDEPRIKVDDDGKRGVSFADLRADGCKFAVTPHQVREHLFCNSPRMPGKPYCAGHCEKARGRVAQDLEAA
jgi:GcrA cell cycle regulator